MSAVVLSLIEKLKAAAIPINYSPQRHILAEPGIYHGAIAADFVERLAAAREYRAIMAAIVLQRAVVERKSWKVAVDAAIKGQLGWHRKTWPGALEALAEVGAAALHQAPRKPTIADCQALCARSMQFYPYAAPIPALLQAVGQTPAAALTLLAAQRALHVTKHNPVALLPILQKLGMERRTAAAACQALHDEGLLRIRTRRGMVADAVIPRKRRRKS
jgi:hypothetical protein